MITPHQIEEVKKSDLFQRLCTALSNRSTPDIVLTALIYGIDEGKRSQTFPLPHPTREDYEFVLSEIGDENKLEEGLKNLLDYSPFMADHLTRGITIAGVEAFSIAARNIVFFFMILQRAAERREIEDLEFLVRD